MARQQARAGAGPRRRRSAFGRVVGWGLRLLALMFLALASGLVVFVLSQADAAPDGTRTDGVAVLTGGPGRIDRGVAVLEAGLAGRMLVSGVDQKVRASELAAAAGISPRLLACCIDLGFAADSTRSNADEVARWVERHRFTSIRLVTAGYHMPRAETELRARLPAGVTIVADGVSAPLPPFAMLWEYAKFLGSWVTLRVQPA